MRFDLLGAVATGVELELGLDAAGGEDLEAAGGLGIAEGVEGGGAGVVEGLDLAEGGR